MEHRKAAMHQKKAPPFLAGHMGWLAPPEISPI